MSKSITININNKEYPCRQTLGAMLRFKRETGKEVTEMDAGSITDTLTFLYCCIKSECKNENIEFNMSLDDFADALSPEDLEEWNKANAPEDGADEAEGNGEKKS